MRLGGDEFALLVTLAPTDDSRQIAVGILDRITEPFTIDGARLLVNASAGVAERNGAAVGIVDLLRRADVAMYAAKDAHSRAERYDPHLDEVNRIRLETIQDLSAALDQHELVLHYQPKIDVRPVSSSAPRRSCAGSTPPAGCSTRTHSSRSSSRSG